MARLTQRMARKRSKCGAAPPDKIVDAANRRGIASLGIERFCPPPASRTLENQAGILRLRSLEANKIASTISTSFIGM